MHGDGSAFRAVARRDGLTSRQRYLRAAAPDHSIGSQLDARMLRTERLQVDPRIDIKITGTGRDAVNRPAAEPIRRRQFASTQIALSAGEIAVQLAGHLHRRDAALGTKTCRHLAGVQALTDAQFGIDQMQEAATGSVRQIDPRAAQSDRPQTLQRRQIEAATTTLRALPLPNLPAAIGLALNIDQGRDDLERVPRASAIKKGVEIHRQLGAFDAQFGCALLTTDPQTFKRKNRPARAPLATQLVEMHRPLQLIGEKILHPLGMTEQPRKHQAGDADHGRHHDQ